MRIRSSKVTASHRTCIEEARVVVKTAERLPNVTKISLGPIKQIRRGAGRRRLKFGPATGGLRVSVRGTGALQEVYLYTKDPERTREAILEAF